MTDLSQVTIISTAQTALRKLKNANIGVYNCKKDGARFIFSIKDKDVKKVFAIFSKPCYNVRVAGSKRENFFARAVIRVGLLVGALLFVCAAAISNLFVLKIEVSGSGSYLSADVKRILQEQGFGEFSAFKKLDAPAARGAILSLPQVTFCNIEKHGSILRIDVQTDEELRDYAVRQPLKADRSGTVKKIAVICGTAAVEVNCAVKPGDVLIHAYSGEDGADCIAVGYVQLECTASYEYSAPAESPAALKAAYSKANLYSDSILSRTHTVRRDGDGVKYLIEFTYLQKLSINME